MTSILMLAECYHPIRNGVVTSVDTFSKSLKRRGHKVTILTSNNKDKNIYYDEQNMVYRFPAVTLPLKTNYPLPIPYIDSSLNKIIYDNNFDMVHSQSLMTMGKVGRSIAKKLKIPLVFTYHTLLEEYAHYFPFLPQDVITAIARDISFKYCESADHVIVPSQHVYDKLREMGITSPMEVVPTGINLKEIEESKACDLKKYGIPDGAKVIAYAGRIAKEKNIETLLDVYKIILKEMPNVHIIIAGGGPLYDYCVDKCGEMPYGERVHLTNYISKLEVLSILRTADVMIFTSYSETQGLVFAESMASGTPVIATDSKAAKEIIEDGLNGIICKNNPEELSNACKELLNNDSLYKNMRNEAIKRTKDYDDEKMTDKLLAVYNSALAKYNGTV